ncbi:MAG: NTP transferase domain-containing protein [Oligoflexia bacterium]|nr:NTP transferase domain-containing protein [Oligoflexia bacterium]
MKGIVLAGGTGSRLFPLTKVTNKHLLPVGQKPMIFYPIEKLRGIGCQDILIVTGVEHMGDVVTLLGSGKDYGCRFTYKVQDEAGGIAQALGLASQFARDDKMCVILGDNLIHDSLKPFAEDFVSGKSRSKIILKEVEDPQRFGVAEIKGDKIVAIEEKPKSPKSNFAVTGIYFYTPDVFEIIRTLKPSGRGELEITDVNNAYVKEGAMSFNIIENWWSDAGTFESLAKANELVRQKPPLP